MKQPTIRLALATFRLKVQQLTNDLVAAKRREENMREAELKLTFEINALRNSAYATRVSLQQMTDERDDWRDAFKLIMKLVK